MRRALILTALLAIALAWTPATRPARADPAPVPLGPAEVLPEPPDRFGHTPPAVALRPDGGFVAAWVDLIADQVVGRWVGPPELGGTPESGLFTLSDEDGGIGRHVVVARSGAGTYLAIWTVGFHEPDLFARAFDGQGNALSEVRPIASPTVRSHAPMDLAPLPGGGFALAWWQGPLESAQLRLRFLASDGTPVGSATVVNLPPGAGTPTTHVAGDPEEGVIVSWSWYDHAEDRPTVQARAFSSAGGAVGPTVDLVPDGSSGASIEHDLAAVGPGEYLVAWSDRSGPEAPRLLVQRFDADGTTAPPHRLDPAESPDAPTRHPALAAAADGQAVAAWSQGSGADDRVLARLVDAEGEPRSNVFPVHLSLDVGDYVNDLDVVRDAAGRLVFAWGVGRESNILPTDLDLHVSSQIRRFLEPDPACAPVSALDFRTEPELPQRGEPVQLVLDALTDCADLSLVDWSREGTDFRLEVEADPQACAGPAPPVAVSVPVPVGALDAGDYAVAVDAALPEGGTCSRDFAFSVETGETPPPPDAPSLVSGELPGFRTWVRINAGPGDSVPGAQEAPCIPETLCVSGRVPGRSEVFVRIVGPKPNGRLWPTLVKFTTSEVEVWIEQVATGEVRYYRLAGASPGVDELPGRFDRGGFEP